MNSPRFSIIIPCYKVEDYLPQCIESVIKQTFNDYEIILVDDGSPDRCGEICEEYARKQDNISVYHKKNGGLSDARNFGLSHAIGQYIIFLDSDDWIEDGSLETINNVIGDDIPDVVETRLVENYENKIEYKDPSFDEYLKIPFDNKRAMLWCCTKTQSAWPAVKKIYLRSFIENNDIRFLKGRLHEDLDWTSKVLYHATSFIGCPEYWYHHRMERKGAITNSIKERNIIDLIEMANSHYDTYIKHKDFVHTLVFMRIMDSVYQRLHYISKYKMENPDKLYKCIKDNIRIFGIANRKTYKLFSIVLRIFGPKFALSLIKVVR